MARSTFGGFGGDQVSLDPAGNSGYYKAATNYTTGTFWSASTGGTQYTDLIDPVTSVALAGVSTDAHGHVIPFKGPDGVLEGWLDFGGGRFKVTAIDPYALDVRYAALPASPTAYSLYSRDGSNNPTWTTSSAVVARALGWQVLASTGGSDDGPMINTAIAALPAGGGDVWLAGGSQYNTTTTITQTDGVRLRGAGVGGTRIVYSGTGYAISAGANGNWTIESLTITTSTGGGIQIAGSTGGAHNNQIKSCRFFCSNASKGSIDLTGNVNELTIDNCLIQNIAAGGGINAAFGANNVRVTNNSFAASGAGNGVALAVGCDSWFFFGNNFEGSAVGVVGIVAGGTTATTIIGNYFEQWIGACVSVNNATGARGVAIIGNSMQATSSASACVPANSSGGNVGFTYANNNHGTLGNASMTSVGLLPGSTKQLTTYGNTSQGSSSTVVQYTAPSLAGYLGGAGTSPPTPTFTASGDRGGTVSWGTGTSPAAGNQLQVGFGHAFTATTQVTISPLNAATAALQPYVAGVSAGSGGFVIAFGVAPAASQASGTYQVSFVVAAT